MNEIAIIQGDCLEELRKLDRACVDMVFADPPYFLSREGGTTCRGGRRVDVAKGEWDRPTMPDEMHEFNRRWISLCAKVLKPTGSMFACGTHHNIGSVLFALQQLGWKVLNLITWIKPNPPPNLGCRTLKHSTEQIIWACRQPLPKEPSRHWFDYGMARGHGCGRQLRDIWQFNPPRRNESIHGKHPAQKPEALIGRTVLIGCPPGGLVVDPFAGSCTTAVVAKRSGRRCLAIERDPVWVETGRARVAQESHQTDLFGD